MNEEVDEANTLSKIENQMQTFYWKIYTNILGVIVSR